MKNAILTAMALALTALAWGGFAWGAGAETEAPASLAASVREVFHAGGAVMWLLLATSMVGVTFALERGCALRRSRHMPFELAEHVCWLEEHEGVASAMEYASASDSSLGRVLETILSHHADCRQEVEAAVEGEMARLLSDERRNLRVVGVAGTMAPLMGLLGTVLGMIDAFRQAAKGGMDDPANFAGGIYQALYTTAFGLMVSLFLLVLYHGLRGRLERVLREVEDKAVAYVHQEFYRPAPITVVAEADTESEVA